MIKFSSSTPSAPPLVPLSSLLPLVASFPSYLERVPPSSPAHLLKEQFTQKPKVSPSLLATHADVKSGDVLFSYNKTALQRFNEQLRSQMHEQHMAVKNTEWIRKARRT